MKAFLKIFLLNYNNVSEFTPSSGYNDCVHIHVYMYICIYVYVYVYVYVYTVNSKKVDFRHRIRIT